MCALLYFYILTISIHFAIMINTTGEHLATDDDNTYTYIHVSDEPDIEEEYDYV